MNSRETMIYGLEAHIPEIREAIWRCERLVALAIELRDDRVWDEDCYCVPGIRYNSLEEECSILLTQIPDVIPMAIQEKTKRAILDIYLND